MKKILSLILSCIITISILPTTIYAASVPSAPTISSYTAISSSSIKIKWGSVSGATKYRVDRRRSDESDYKTLTSSRTATDYTDTGLKAGTKYYYRVYAINSAGTSKRSTTYQLYTMPDAPVISNVTRDSDTQLTVLWNKVSGATKYKIVYRRGDTEDYQTLTTSATGTSYTHKNLTSGSRYWYRVYAILEGDIGNEGDRTTKNISSERSETVGEFTKIAQPSVWVDNNNTSYVNFSWSKTYGNSDYSYDIYRKAPTDSDFYKIARTKNLSYTDTGLTSGVIYSYRIITVVTDTGDICTRSDPFYAGPKITKSIVLTPQSGTSMKISWDKPTSETGLTYTVLKWVNDAYITYGTTSNTYYIDNGLTTGNTYRYYIQVRDSVGNFATSSFGNSAVLQILPTSISLNKTAINLNDGDTYKLSATISPSNSTNTSTTWSSSNTNVATVSSDGTVTAKLKGSTTITVKTSNGKYATCTVNVVNCQHSYSAWVTVSEPTCEKNGSRYRTCGKCNETETEMNSALGHSYSEEWTTIVEPTCLNDGEEARLCTVCSAQIDNRLIEKLNHNFSGDWMREKEPTCTGEGVEYRLCSLCTTTKETREIERIEHNYQLISTETIESETAITEIFTYKCTYCEDKYEDRHVIEKELAPTLVVDADTDYVKAGDTFTATVSIENNPGINAFVLFLNYNNSVFTPIKNTDGRYITKGSLIESIGSLTCNLDLSSIDPLSQEYARASWFVIGDTDNPASNDITDDGELFKITFQVKENVILGEYPLFITYEDEGSITNGDGNDIIVDVISDKIKVYGETLKGDVNQDLKVNSHDIIMLSKHLADWKQYAVLTEEQFEAADVFKDEKITTKDGTRLAQILAGYKIEEVEATSTISLLSVASLEYPEIIVGSCQGVQGDYVDIPVKIKNNSGIAGFKFTLTYNNEYLTPETIYQGNILAESITTNINQTIDENGETVNIENVVVNWNESDNVTDDGVLFTLRFKIKEDTPIGTSLPIELSYENGNVCMIDGSDIVNVSPVITQGAVQVIAETPSLQYEITDASAVSDGGKKYESIPVNGDFNLKVYVQNLVELYTPATVFAAAYDASERLLSLNSKELTEARLNEGVCSIYIDKSKQDISYIKIFIWDSNTTLKPLAYVYCVQ